MTEIRQRELFSHRDNPCAALAAEPTALEAELANLDDRTAPASDQYVSVAVEAPLFSTFTYRVPAQITEMPLATGLRVVVPLGRANTKTIGFVTRRVSHDQALTASGGRPIKAVCAQLDGRPLMTPAVFELARRLADYYCCPLGMALSATVPAAVKNRAGERKIRIVSLPHNPVLRPRLTAKQSSVLEALAQAHGGPMAMTELATRAGASVAIIRRMAELGLVALAEVRAWDWELPGQATWGLWSGHIRPSELTLNAQQQAALEAVRRTLVPAKFAVTLLHGVTGSGKTEVYLRAIEEVVRAGRQAIMLVPEIALTPQTQERFEHRFGAVAVLHSHMTDSARHLQWRRIASGAVPVVVGARSAVFAPLARPGLIVVDEEHDTSYKQHDPAPRYHARDVAVMRGQLENIPVLMGSATPALETLHNARNRPHYQYCALTGRVESRAMPTVEIVDRRAELRRRPGSSIISGALQAALSEAFAADQQAILLLNRRGHSTFMICGSCGYIARCEHCDVSLVWHSTHGLGACHHCGATRPPPSLCPACNQAIMQRLGAGTQKLEEELSRLFPGVRMARMDSDTTEAAGSHETILSDFRERRLQLLLGTQMIAKGLDFPAVTVVGVINADTSLALPDFRADERTFQLVAQVAGRAGRGTTPGRVLVQTFEPNHAPIRLAATHDYNAFAELELAQRAALAYPPYSRLVSFVVRHADRQTAQRQAGEFQAALTDLIAVHRLAVSFRSPEPTPAPLAKLAGLYRFVLVVAASSPPPLQSLLAKVRRGRWLTEMDILVDVDPVMIL